jgi:hypothetical protein
MTHRTSNPPRSPGAEPREPILKSARELNCRERLLTARDAANLLRLSPSWLAVENAREGNPDRERHETPSRHPIEPIESRRPLQE